MFIALVIWIIALAIVAFALSVPQWRNAVAAWLERIWVDAQILIDHLRTFLFWFFWFAVIDHILLLCFVVLDMHSAIIGWALVNGLLLYLAIEVSQIRFLKPLQQPLGYIVLIWTIAALFEAALPGVIKNGGIWIFGLVIVPLLLGQVITRMKSGAAGHLGITVLKSWIIIISLVVVVNFLFDDLVTQQLVNYQMSKTTSERVTWAKVVHPTGVYREQTSGFGPFSETRMVEDTTVKIQVGDYVSIPINRKDFDANGFPTIEYQRRVLVPVILKYGDFFDDEEYWILAQSIEQTENPMFSKVKETPKTDTEQTETINEPVSFLGTLLWEGTVGVNDWVDTRLIANGNGVWLVPGDGMEYRISERNPMGYAPSLRQMETLYAGLAYCSDDNIMQQSYKVRSMDSTKNVKIYSK